MKIKKVIIFALFFALTGCGPRKEVPQKEEEKNEILICVNQFIEHPNLDVIMKHVEIIIGEWAASHDKKVNVELQNANGSILTASTIARIQASAHPDLILSLATASSQASKRFSNGIPVVFAAVTDPVGAGLVNDLTRPEANITGTSDRVDFAHQFEFLLKLFPNARKIGILRNLSESNSVTALNEIGPVFLKRDLTKIERAVASVQEVPTAMRSLVGQVDLIYLPPDNTVLAALPAILKIAENNRIPVVASDEGSVEAGAIATMGIDYAQLGSKTGEIIVDVLEGKNISEIPIYSERGNKIYINREAVRLYNLNWDSELIKNAEYVD